MTYIDPVAMIFYAVVCALLAAYAPRETGRVTRLVLGAAVGLVAAVALPSVRGTLGF
ncbi:MAG: hypothetical protein AAF919_01845 [Pseudomonadota bacterium]